MPDPSPENQPDFIQEQIDKISPIASQQAALLDISRAVQDIEGIDDLERVQVMFEQMKNIGLAISRVEDLERLAAQNVELAQANASLKKEITERKRAEAALVEAERLRALMETAGAVAHEINQPLTVIIGLSQLVMNKLPVNDPDRKDLHDIMGAGMTISRILKKMQNIRQYANRHYIGDLKIVDFDVAGRKDQDRG